MLSVRDLSKKFRTDFWKKEFYALKGVTFSLDEGKITGFLGANGAGKTTLIKTILQFIKPTEGEVSWSLGSHHNEIFKYIGYMPERPYYYKNLTGREFLQYCGEISGLKGELLNDRILHWTQEFKIDYALDRLVKSYSKGMLQRLGFSSALLHNPKFIILDEPLSGLDPIGRKEFKDVILKLKSEGKTVFFSSHIISDVEEVCDNVVVLQKGELIYSGSIHQLLEKSSTDKFRISIPYNEELYLKFKDYVINSSKDIILMEVESGLKQEVIESSYKSGINSIENIKPTLEDVIYNVKEIIR